MGRRVYYEETGAFVVLDNGRPVMDAGRASEYRFHTFSQSKSPVALFESYNKARQIKKLFQSRYQKIANDYSPNSPDSAFHGWVARAKAVRIKRVVQVGL